MPTKKPTIASAVEVLQGRVETLDQAIDRVRKTREFDKAEADRTRRGATRANHEAERAHRRVDNLEERTGVIETTSIMILDRLTTFAGFFRAQQEDGALHEERISRLETTSNATSYGSIFATWLAVVVSVVVGMLIAHAYLAERFTAFYQGKTIDIGSHPAYDAIFWVSGIVAVFATTAAALVAAYFGYSSSLSSTKTSSSSKSSTTSSASSNTVAEDYVYVETNPTEVMPVVRV